MSMIATNFTAKFNSTKFPNWFAYKAFLKFHRLYELFEATKYASVCKLSS